MRILGFFLGVSLLTGFVTQASAETIQVPQDWDTITSAVAEAEPGDIVEITDSTTYDEEISIDKAITLMASPGATPTITSFSTSDGAEGAQIGSNDGGLITLANSDTVIQTRHSGVDTPVTFENIRAIATGEMTYFVNTRYSGSVHFRNVEFDGQDNAERGFMFSPDDEVGMDAVFTFERCRLTGMTTFPLWSYNARDDYLNNPAPIAITLEYCEFGGADAESSYDTFVLNRNSEVTLTINRSLIHGSNAGAIDVWNQNSNNVINITRSVILMNRNEGNQAIDIPGTDGHQVIIDHSDLIATGDEGLINIASGGANRYFSITNSNLITNTGDIIDGELGDSDVAEWDYNNLFTTSGDTYSNITPGANDLNEDPGYTDIAGADFTYSNQTVLAGDEEGGPIGVSENYSDIINFVDGPTTASGTITVADGIGADAYAFVDDPDTALGVGDPAFQLRFGNNGEYRAYLRFDVSSFNADNYTSLTLEWWHRVDNTVSIDIYGINDGHPAETWSESELTWNNAPDLDDSGSTTPLASVATYITSYDNAHDGFDADPANARRNVFTSPELIDFFNQDSDGRVSLILVASQIEIPGFESDDSVGIWGKEHEASGDLEAGALAARIHAIYVPSETINPAQHWTIYR